MATDALDRARGSRTSLERLGASIPGFRGYLERELRREVDQLLRAELAARIDTARQRVMAFAKTLPLARSALLVRLSGEEKRLDQLANTLRHAGSGYAGLFDAVKLREEQLETLYRYDLSLVESVDGLVAIASQLAADAGVAAELEAATEKVGAAIAGRDAAVKSVLTA
jgi:hypothetical protein